MIKENKKNKIITFLCACLMVCASALGLVSAVGTTLASSPTQPTITTAYFNYKDSNFLNLFDGYIRGFKTGTSGTQLVYNINHITDLPSAYNATGFSITNFYTLSGSSVSGLNTFVDNVFTTDGMFGGLPSITFTFANATNFISGMNDIYSKVLVFSYNGTYYTICPLELYTKHIAYMEGMAEADTTSAYNNGYNTGYTEGYDEGELEGYENGYQEGVDFGFTQGVNAVLNNPNNYGLYTLAQYQQNYTDGYNAGLTQGQNNVLNNPNDFGLNTNQQLQDSYNQGFADGEQSSEAYQNGYDTGFTDGSNEVLNNPNNYNLYTQAQYQQNYTDGYDAGVLNSQYGVLSNVKIQGSVEVNGVGDGVNNSDFNFNSGTITPNASLLSKLNDIFTASPEDTAYAFIEFFFNEQYIYSRDNIINFVNLSLLPNQTSYLPVTYETNSNQTVALIYSYNPIIENDVFTGFNIGVIGDDSSLIGNTIKSFTFSYLQSHFVGADIFITNDNLVRPQALSIFANNVAFNNGYKVGYIDGTRSDVVNNAYDKGAVEGFNDGYAQGLANQDNATFASMISAVIDVPINAMRNLFNFELLGINLFGFFTALFTLLVVITIVRLLLGGK